jgi:hypothetical protein
MLTGEAAGIDAYGARKLQTSHGARLGHMGGGALGTVNLVRSLVAGVKNRTLKPKDLLTLKGLGKLYLTRYAPFQVAGAATGAYWWHGGHDVAKERKEELDALKRQILLDASVRAAVSKNERRRKHIKEHELSEEKTASLFIKPEQAFVKTSALPNLLKTLKKAKEEGAPIDPAKERALKILNKGLKEADRKEQQRG